mgnify:CR=1 FL=1
MNKLSFADLVELIMNYGADTFSSSKEDVSREEAEEIAEQMIYVWINNNLDGQMLTEALGEERQKNLNSNYQLPPR